MTAQQPMAALAPRFPAPSTRRLITLELSARCTLRCRMCGLDEFYRPQGLLSREVLDAVLEDLADFEDLDFGVNAEPLLHPDFPSILALVRARAPNLHLHAVTNGMDLHGVIADALLRHRLDTLSVSFDAATDATYRAVRRGGSWARLLANVEALMRRRRALGVHSPELRTTYTLQRANLAELPDFLALAQSLGIEHVHLNHVEVYRESEHADSLLLALAPTPRDPHRQDASLLAQVLDEARAVARALGVTLHEPREVPRDLPGCRFVAPLVTWDGEVTPCAALSYPRPYLDLDGRWRDFHRLSFGSVLDRPFADIWNSDDARRFRGQVELGDWPEECVTCPRRFDVICG